MTLVKAKARAIKAFIVQASLTIFTYDRKNIFNEDHRQKIFK